MEGNNTSESTAKSDPHSNVWECHICIQLPTDPVATSCGHIFCWPCIYQWLRNGPRPCPICRTHLNKDRNILPLYGGGARAAGPTHGNNGDSRNSNGDGGGDSSAVETADSDHDVIPPRPRNALSFLAAGATTHLGGSNSESATHEAEEDSNSQPSLRDLVLETLQQATVTLERRVNDLEQRNRRHLQTIIVLIQHIRRFWRQIVRNDQMLGRANALLPPGWSDGML